MIQGTTSAVFAYDADGFRTLKTVGGVTTNFVTDKNRDYAQVVAEVEGGTTKATYTYAADLISQNRSGTSSYYLYDALGSVKALSDSTGAVTDTYNYTAFGKDLNHTGTTANNYKFAGEQYDGALDNYYLRARYYNQNVGRFTQMDSYQGNGSDPITLHKYLYAGLNPVSYTDPSGNSFLGEMTTAQKINAILITTNIAITGYSIFDITTSDASVGSKARQLGVLALLSFGGGASAKFILTKIAAKKAAQTIIAGTGSVILPIAGKVAPKELAAAIFLAEKTGATVVVRATGTQGADFVINGLLWELKTPNSPTDTAVANLIKKSIKRGQSDRIIIDGRASGLTLD